MSFDLVREISGKSIASAIAGGDGAVRPRSFRRAGAVLPARSLQRRARLPKRDATLLLRGVGDRVNTLRARWLRSRAAWFRKAGKPAVDIAKQLVAGPAFADASLPGSFGIPSKATHSAVGHLIPFLALCLGGCSDDERML